jgi:hypothetical protein
MLVRTASGYFSFLRQEDGIRCSRRPAHYRTMIFILLMDMCRQKLPPTPPLELLHRRSGHRASIIQFLFAEVLQDVRITEPANSGNGRAHLGLSRRFLPRLSCYQLSMPRRREEDSWRSVLKQWWQRFIGTAVDGRDLRTATQKSGGAGVGA